MPENKTIVFVAIGHYAIINQEIVWYGSMNLLSGEKEDDNLMRVVSAEIAQELMEQHRNYLLGLLSASN